VTGRTPDGVTHALYERFPSKETLEQHMQHPAGLKVAEELLTAVYAPTMLLHLIGYHTDSPSHISHFLLGSSCFMLFLEQLTQVLA
jgi:hypothetical protein